MDFLFPRDDRERLQFKEAALQIGFEELTAECNASIHLLQPHDKLSVLTMAWKKIGDYLTHNQYMPSVGSVVKWIGRHTLELWFGREWTSCPPEGKTTLIESMMKVYPTAYIAMCPYSWPYMFSIYRDPWMVDYLNSNFQRMNEPELSDYLEPRDSDFIQQEGMALTFLRIVNMFDFNMMKLVKHTCRRLLLAWHDPSSSAHRSLRVAINGNEYIDYVRHMYLITIYETIGIKELHYVLECVQRNLHCNAIVYNNLDRAAHIIAQGLLECKQTLVDFLILFLSKVPERQFSNTFGNSVDRYRSFLIEYLLRKIHNRKAVGCAGNMSADVIYDSLLKMFIKKRESSEELMKSTPAVSERLFARVHDLRALKFSYDIIKSLTRSEWYTTKITLLLGIISAELNILEDCKFTEGQTAHELIKKEQELAIYYRDLSRLLGRIPVLEQEAWLTAFSLNPCKEYLDAVIRCGSRNLRAIKKQAIRLNVIVEVKQPRPAKPPLTPIDNEGEQNKSSSGQLQLFAEDLSLLDFPPVEVSSCTSLVRFEGNLSIQEGAPIVTEPPTPTVSFNKPGPRPKSFKSKSAQLVPTDTKKPPIDGKENTAEALYAASAGAADNVSCQTEQTIKYPGFAVISSVTDTEDTIRYTAYEGQVADQYKELTRILSNIRLQCSDYDDLLALLVAPRYKRLTWSTCWKNLRKRCRFLLTKDNRKKELVEQYLADANERLTHLEIDYEKYKNKPQIDYGSIESGYEAFEKESTANRGRRPTLRGKLKRALLKLASDEPDRSDEDDEDDLSDSQSVQSTPRIDEEHLLENVEHLIDFDQEETADAPESQPVLQEASILHLPDDQAANQQIEIIPEIPFAKAVASIQAKRRIHAAHRKQTSPYFRRNPTVLVHRLQVSSVVLLPPRIQTAATVKANPRIQERQQGSSQALVRVEETPSVPATSSTPAKPTVHRDPTSRTETSSDQRVPRDVEPPDIQPDSQVKLAAANTTATPITETPPRETTSLAAEADNSPKILRVYIPKVPLRTYSRRRVLSEKAATSKAEVSSVGSSKKTTSEQQEQPTNEPTENSSDLATNTDKLGDKKPLRDSLSLEIDLEKTTDDTQTLKENTDISEREIDSDDMDRNWHYHPPVYDEEPPMGYEYDDPSEGHEQMVYQHEQEQYASHSMSGGYAESVNYAATEMMGQQGNAPMINHPQGYRSFYYRSQTNIGHRPMMRPQVQPIYVHNVMPHRMPYPRQQYRSQQMPGNFDHSHHLSVHNTGIMTSSYFNYQEVNAPLHVPHLSGDYYTQPLPITCVTICNIQGSQPQPQNQSPQPSMSDQSNESTTELMNEPGDIGMEDDQSSTDDQSNLDEQSVANSEYMFTESEAQNAFSEAHMRSQTHMHHNIGTPEPAPFQIRTSYAVPQTVPQTAVPQSVPQTDPRHRYNIQPGSSTPSPRYVPYADSHMNQGNFGGFNTTQQGATYAHPEQPRTPNTQSYVPRFAYSSNAPSYSRVLPPSMSLSCQTGHASRYVQVEQRADHGVDPNPAVHSVPQRADTHVPRIRIVPPSTINKATYDINAPSCSRATPVSVNVPGPSRHVPELGAHSTQRDTQSVFSANSSHADPDQPSYSGVDIKTEIKTEPNVDPEPEPERIYGGVVTKKELNYNVGPDEDIFTKEELLSDTESDAGLCPWQELDPEPNYEDIITKEEPQFQSACDEDVLIINDPGSEPPSKDEFIKEEPDLEPVFDAEVVVKEELELDADADADVEIKEEPGLDIEPDEGGEGRAEPEEMTGPQAEAMAKIAAYLRGQTCSPKEYFPSILKNIPIHDLPLPLESGSLYPYTYFPPELNTVQIVKPSGTTRINKMTLELGQGIRTLIPNNRRDLLQMTNKRFPNPRWRPFYNCMLKRKLIYTPTEREAAEILKEYAGQRHNGRWVTEIVTFGLEEDVQSEEVTDETVIINLTNPPYDSPKNSDVNIRERPIQGARNINQSRAEVEGKEAGVRYDLKPPIHFYLGIPTPAYNLCLVCPYDVQGPTAPLEILTIHPDFSYRVILFLKDDDFTWDLLGLNPIDEPSNHESDDDEIIEFPKAPPTDVANRAVVNMNTGARLQPAQDVRLNQAAGANRANDGDGGNGDEPPEGEDEPRDGGNNEAAGEGGEQDEEGSESQTDEQGDEAESDNEENVGEDAIINLDSNDDSNDESAVSNNQPALRTQKFLSLDDSDSESPDENYNPLQIASHEETTIGFNLEQHMREYEPYADQEAVHIASDSDNESAGPSGSSAGPSGIQRSQESLPVDTLTTIASTTETSMATEQGDDRTATKRTMEESDSDCEIFVRRSGRYAQKVYGSRKRARGGPSTSDRWTIPLSQSKVREICPEIICLSSSSSDDDK